MTSTSIDLREVGGRVRDLVSSTLRTFAREHPDIVVGCVALFSYPAEGTVDICIDERVIAELEDVGYFHCAEFRFHFLQEMFLADWRAAYWNREDGQPICIVRKDGASQLVDTERDGERALNAAILPFLREELCQSLSDPAWNEVRTRPDFGLGVQFQDSDVEAYWVAKSR